MLHTLCVSDAVGTAGSCFSLLDVTEEGAGSWYSASCDSTPWSLSFPLQMQKWWLVLRDQLHNHRSSWHTGKQAHKDSRDPMSNWHFSGGVQPRYWLHLESLKRKVKVPTCLVCWLFGILLFVCLPRNSVPHCLRGPVPIYTHGHCFLKLFKWKKWSVVHSTKNIYWVPTMC